MRSLVLILFLGMAASAHAAGFDIIGHRGTRGYRPENTIPAFAEAFRRGATKVELDVVPIKGNQVVVAHDPRVNGDLCRGPYVGRRFKTLTLAQVRRMNCGQRQVHDVFRRTETAIPGAHIPELRQVLRLVRPTRGRILVEIKQDPTDPHDFDSQRHMVDVVAHDIHQQHMVHRVTVQSFNWGTLRALARVAPHVREIGLANSITVYPRSPWLGGTVVSAKPFTAGLCAAAHRAHLDGVATAAPLVSPTTIKGAHDRGMRFYAYTVDSPSKMAALITMGVDGIVTDYPDRLRAAATQAGVRIAR